jgi:hypothetical protein
MGFCINFLKNKFTYFLMAFGIAIYQGCGEFESSQSSLSPGSVNLSEQDFIEQGKALYSQNCASCHGPIDTSTKKGRNSGQIWAAIDSIPQMQSLANTLSEDSVDAIASALLYEASGGGLELNEQGQLRFACTPGSISKTPLLKLTNREYRHAVFSFLDLFSTNLKNDTQLLNIFSGMADDQITMDRNTLKEQPRLTSQLSTLSYFNAAYRAAELMAAQTSALRNVPGSNGCLEQSTISANCHQTLVNYLAPIAFRRNIPSSELSSLATQLFDSGLNRNQQLIFTLTSLMQWPDFQYKSYIYGNEVPGQAGLIALSGPELASRLSFLITGAPPDSQLRSLGLSGQIMQADQLSAQVDRLLQTPLARQNIARFFRESYGYNVFDGLNYPSNYLEGVNVTGLERAMVEELDDYFSHLTINQSAGFTELMTSRYANISHNGLRSIYQINTTGATTLPARRAGFLNRAAFLTKRSGTLPSPIMRGLDILEHVLCVEVGQPPPSAPTALPDLGDQILSTRQRTEALSEVPQTTCVACHGRFNPLGYAFSNFDTLGRDRTEERLYDGSGNIRATLPVDTQATSSEIHSQPTSYGNSSDLVNELSNSGRAQLCLVRHLKKFEARTNPNQADNCQMNEAIEGLQGDDSSPGSVREAIKRFVLSEQFRHWSF